MYGDLKIPVTIIIPVKNEEKNLPKCLELLNDFSEVIVVDSHSTDNTPDIVKQFGYQLIDFQWDGHFPKKRNWVLRNVPLKNDWVFFLDADEFVTEKFKQELCVLIEKNEYCGLWITHSNTFLGRKLKHGLKIKKLPIFRKDCGEYEFIEENSWSVLDMEVHEHPIIKGKTYEIHTPLIHEDFKGLYHYISRHNDYSSWEAKRYLKLLNGNKQTFTFKQKIKYALLNTYLFGLLHFIVNYFVFLGFLDGKAGFMYSVYKMQYFFQIKSKLFELTKINIEGGGLTFIKICVLQSCEERRLRYAA